MISNCIHWHETLSSSPGVLETLISKAPHALSDCKPLSLFQATPFWCLKSIFHAIYSPKSNEIYHAWLKMLQFNFTQNVYLNYHVSWLWEESDQVLSTKINLIRICQSPFFPLLISSFSNRYKIFGQAQQCQCCSLCKIPKWLIFNAFRVQKI